MRDVMGADPANLCARWLLRPFFQLPNRLPPNDRPKEKPQPRCDNSMVALRATACSGTLPAGTTSPCGDPMDRPSTIAKLNIEHYRRLLAAETDPKKRETISKLLAEEEANAAELEKRERKKS
jgi:hypothetical protein